jgi:hypothetical protein
MECALGALFSILTDNRLIHRQTCVCDMLSAARLNLNTKWKAQAPAKPSMAYNAVCYFLDWDICHFH